MPPLAVWVGSRGENDVEVGEQTPLLVRSGSKTYTDTSFLQSASLQERAVTIAAVLSFITSILSVVWWAHLHPSVWISGLLGALLTPYAAWSQHKLTQVQALQVNKELLQQQVASTEAENTRLSKQVQAMEETVLNLEAMEETLETLQTIAKKGDQSSSVVQQLERDLQASREALQKRDGNVRAEILHQLLKTVVLMDDQNRKDTQKASGRANGNGDSATDDWLLLSDEDIHDLLYDKLHTLPNVDVDEDAFRRVIIQEQGRRSLPAVMALAQNLLQEEDGDGSQRIFTIHPQQ